MVQKPGKYHYIVIGDNDQLIKQFRRIKESLVPEKKIFEALF